MLKRGKKKYYHFLYPVTYLNRRKSPSATLVSKEIETDFFRRRFSRSRGSSRKVTDVPIVRGGWEMPPKKKAKTVEKPSPAYLAELKKLGRVERKYVLGVQETAEFKLYPDEKNKGVWWLITLVSSHEENTDMRIFEEAEEYWNDITKVKDELKKNTYKRNIIWEGTVVKNHIGVLTTTGVDFSYYFLMDGSMDFSMWNGKFFLTYHRDQGGDVKCKRIVPEELGWEALEGFLREKLKLGFESGS